MHPILSNRVALVLYLVVFLIIGLVLAALLSISSTIPWSAAIAFSIPLALLLGLICLSSWYICRSFPLRTTSVVQIAGVFFVAAVVSAGIWVLLAESYASLLASLPFAESLSNRTLAQILLLGGTGIGLYLLSVAVHYVLMMFEQSKEDERKALELQLLAQTAELKALQSQVNPHFLFNSLNSISALTTKDPPAARSMTLLLADFLRQTLKAGTNDLILFQEELSLCRKFVEIEQVRFGARLQLTEQTDEKALHCLVPPLILQPLIENAVTHGIAHLVDGGTIVMNAEVRSSRLYVRLENPCDPERPKLRKGGLGITNVRKRLLALSETESRLDVTEDNSTFVAALTLPMIQK
jgi:two-component system sensor histidine kinase AlgZ